jgi:hypothetical protein
MDDSHLNKHHKKVPKRTTNYDVISFSEIVSRHFYVLIKFLFWDKISPFGDHKKVWWRAKRILSHKIWKCHQELRVESKPLTNPELHLCQHGWSLGAIGLYAPPITFSHTFVPLQLLVPLQLSAIIINSMEFVVLPRVFLLEH